MLAGKMTEQDEDDLKAELAQLQSEVCGGNVMSGNISRFLSSICPMFPKLPTRYRTWSHLLIPFIVQKRILGRMIV